MSGLRALTRRQRELRREQAAEAEELRLVPESEWPPKRPDGLKAVMRSRRFLVQVYDEEHGVVRLSVIRSELTASGAWRQGITWEELQRVKREAGFGCYCAVELFPPEADVVNVANMRHLWLLPDQPAFMWRRGAC